MTNIIFTIPKNLIPHCDKRYPFLYLECGRIEVDDRSIKFISKDCEITTIPCGLINCILLGPGTSITHEAIKILQEYNCYVFWVGTQSIKFYQAGVNTTQDTKNLYKQMEMQIVPKKRLEVVKYIFNKRFNRNCEKMTIQQMQGLEGQLVKEQYKECQKKYEIDWRYRNYKLTDFIFQDTANQFLTMFNQYLYQICTSCTLSMGFSPQIGFIHRGSPLPFIYDLQDLYKLDMCIKPQFELTQTENIYSSEIQINVFLNKCKEYNILSTITEDIKRIFKTNGNDNIE